MIKAYCFLCVDETFVGKPEQIVTKVVVRVVRGDKKRIMKVLEREE